MKNFALLALLSVLVMVDFSSCHTKCRSVPFSKKDGGWSYCEKTEYLTGFYRDSKQEERDDEMEFLETARCCTAPPLNGEGNQRCKSAKWWKPLN